MAFYRKVDYAAHFFVGSFSSQGDELGQWRAYADNGRGYALGFETKPLEQTFAKQSIPDRFSNSTFPVTYDDAELARVHHEFVELIFPLLTEPLGRGLPRDVIVEYMTDLSVALAMHVSRSVLFYKHEAYRNEQEYRFLQLHRGDIPPPSVQFRNRPHSLVRYREFDWKSVAAETLKQIVVGPAADEQRGMQFAGDCLRAFHQGKVAITKSQIPYRAS